MPLSSFIQAMKVDIESPFGVRRRGGGRRRLPVVPATYLTSAGHDSAAGTGVRGFTQAGFQQKQLSLWPSRSRKYAA